MTIKAIGTAIENLNDDQRMRVEWTRINPVWEWCVEVMHGVDGAISPAQPVQVALPVGGGKAPPAPV